VVDVGNNREVADAIDWSVGHRSLEGLKRAKFHYPHSRGILVNHERRLDFTGVLMGRIDKFLAKQPMWNVMRKLVGLIPPYTRRYADKFSLTHHRGC
jgi:hypothetical protein